MLVRADRLVETFKIFARVAHIQRMLFEQWAVLETMTPSEYAQFRDALGKASGFQSHQYRALEFVLGNKDASALKPQRHDPRIHAELAARLAAPSLYDEFLSWLARHGHAVPADRLARDFTQPYESSAGVLEVVRAIYADPARNYDAYDMCEKLVDVEERFQLWRFRHMTTVKRIIGFAPGTGGSSGGGGGGGWLLEEGARPHVLSRAVGGPDPDRGAGEILSMLRAIDGYHQDEVGDWVAELRCGHGQHVRHRPPFWVREGC